MTDAIPVQEQAALMHRVLSEKDLIQCNYYFTFYLGRSLKKLGMGNRYPELLGPWYDMLDEGLTTFKESYRGKPSDCHAWSSSPIYECFATIFRYRSVKTRI